MTDTTTNRQPQGIPSGGQFAPTSHSEPDVSLAPIAAAYDEEAQKERIAAIRAKGQAIHRLQSEMDLMNIDAAIASARKYFPEATQLLVDNARHGWTGEVLDRYEPKSLRDKDGNDLTAGDKHWYYRRNPGDDPCEPLVSNFIGSLGTGFFGYQHEGIGHDPETGYPVIDMNHKFSA